MHTYKEEPTMGTSSGISIINVSSDDDKTFMNVKYSFPFMIGKTFFYSTLFQCYYEYDKMVPGWDFSFSFLGLSIYIRHNDDEALVLFDEWNKEIEEAKATGGLKKFKDIFDELDNS